MLLEIASRLKNPTQNMTWLQLAAATAFVITVAVMWRQIVLYIAREV